MVLIELGGVEGFVTEDDARAMMDTYNVAGSYHPRACPTHYYCPECGALHPITDITSRIKHRLEKLGIPLEQMTALPVSLNVAVTLCVATGDSVRQWIEQQNETPATLN